MEQLILFIFTFLLTFIGRIALYLLSKRNKKKGKKKKDKSGLAVEMKYLSMKFKLDNDLVDKRSIATLISCMDALIIASTFAIVITITDNMVLELILGLALIFGLIYGLYEILGRILLKKGYGKNGL